ncbi:MAG: hypothetical protein DMG73_20110 [Acidobacteria bacterium]|nr:MAG: hypothetical protein DMG73_20110 [Acidobacteriota bacterium]
MTLRESNAKKVQAQPADHAVSIEDAVRSTVADILSVAGDPALTEDLALALLKRPDLTSSKDCPHRPSQKLRATGLPTWSAIFTHLIS